MKHLLLMAALLCTLPLFASEQHQTVEYITGSGYDIVKNGDAMTGTIDGMTLTADKSCGNHIMGTLGEQTFVVTTIDDVLQGQFGDTTITLAGISKEPQAIVVKIGEQFIPVFYTTEGFADGHFQGITFNFEVNGQAHSVRLDGEACMGSMIYYSIFFVGIATL